MEVDDAVAMAAAGGWRRLPVMPERMMTAYHRRWPPEGRGPGRPCGLPGPTSTSTEHCTTKGKEPRWRRWASGRFALASARGSPPSTLVFFGLHMPIPLCDGMESDNATAEDLPGEGATRCTRLVLQELAGWLGQFLPAPSPQERCGERRRCDRRGCPRTLPIFFCLGSPLLGCSSSQVL